MNSILKPRFNAKAIILCALFAALTAIGGFIKIPIPPIPVTLQLFFSTLSGILLGSVMGFYSQLIFVVIGLVGVPVFTNGGGIGYFLEPTFGYIIGFIFAAYAIGKIIEKIGSDSFWKIFLASIAGLIVDYLVGVIYLYIIMNFYLGKASPFYSLLWTGAAVFLPKDAVLCALAALVGKRLIPVIKKTAA